MVSFDDLDFWLVKGFGGILNMLHTRLTQFPIKFGRRAGSLLETEYRRFSELREIARTVDGPDRGTEVTQVDRWLVKAFSGIDKMLESRCQEGPPLTEEILKSLEEQAQFLLQVAASQRRSLNQESKGVDS